MGELGIIQLWLLCALYQSEAFPWVFGVGVLKSILSQAFRGCSTGIFLIKLSFLPLTVLSPFKSCSIYSPVLPPILLKQNSPFSPTKPIKALKYLLTSGAEYLLLPGWWILISLMMCACVCLEGKTLPWAVLLTCYRRCCYTVDSKSVRPGGGGTLRICISVMFPGDVYDTGLWTMIWVASFRYSKSNTFGNHGNELPTNTPFFSRIHKRSKPLVLT